MSQVRIQVLIEENTQYGVFRDAIYYPIEEYNALTEQQINAAILERVTNWINVIENPPQPPEQPIEE